MSQSSSMMQFEMASCHRYANLRGPDHTERFFFAMRGLFKIVFYGSERFACCLCTLAALRFSRLLCLVFLQERSEHLKLKK